MLIEVVVDYEHRGLKKIMTNTMHIDIVHK